MNAELQKMIGISFLIFSISLTPIAVAIAGYIYKKYIE